ncbi:MAG: hypothetical protein GY822_15760 [Deltaproteobacteria bacterium]|nr:hypothetical protein [Deltaproteobacteria bacterium]
MRTRTSRIAIALSALALSLGAMTGCITRNDDINRVTGEYFPKSYFDDDTSWYLRNSIVDTPPSTSGAFTPTIGDGHWLVVERFKWQITEDLLIASRDWESVPGTEEQNWEGGEDTFRGNIVAAFPITHFDIQRNYDPLSGEEGNVISENTADRYWYERDYIRVDWASDIMHASSIPGFGGSFLEAGEQAGNYVQSNDPADPKRIRVEEDYLEITVRKTMGLDHYTLFGYLATPYTGDGANPVIDLRYSFMKVDPTNDYIPTDMPPSVVLTDEDGNEMRDEQGYPIREGIWDRFGIYSTLGRTTWNANYGRTSTGELHRATLFKIWENFKDASGAEIPVADRTPKPIIYYTNVVHPKQLMDASINRVGGQWNNGFKEIVFHAQPAKWDTNSDGYASEAELTDVPDMFIVRENDCNITNVQSTFNALPVDVQGSISDAALKHVTLDAGKNLLTTIADRIEWANSTENEDPFTQRQDLETQSLRDLERVCAAMEFFTGPAKIPEGSEISQFGYQRRGDLRYNQLNLVMQDHHAGWLGLGPMLADPVTGETVAAVANIAVSLLDKSAARADQMVQTLNGDLALGDVVYGFDIQNYMTEKLLKNESLVTKGNSAAMLEKMNGRFRELKAGPHGGLDEVSPGAEDARMERLRGTDLEAKMIGAEDMILAQLDPVTGPEYAGMNEEELIRERVSPLRQRHKNGHQEQVEKIWNMGAMTMDPPEFADQFLIGLALKYKDLPARERFEAIRSDIYVAVQLHEVGHNVGLFHNFEASSDALNYGPMFWELQGLDPDIDVAIGQATDQATESSVLDQLLECQRIAAQFNADSGSQNVELTTQACLRQTEAVYASIMDYHANWNADFAGLGMYDKAAIKFAYAGLVEVFADDALASDRTGKEIKRWTQLNDWRDIPNEITDGVDGMFKRKYVKYDWSLGSTTQQFPENAVPYRFCPGGYYGQTPSCKVFDYGPDMRTNAAMNETRYYQNYFFTHFNRDKLWDYGGNGMNGAINSDSRALFDYTQKMQWYYFYKVTDPEFTGSYAEEDFLATTIMGLNHMGHMLSHPGAGHMTTVPKYYMNYYLDNDTTEDRLAASDIMIPYQDLAKCAAKGTTDTDTAGVPSGPRAGHFLGEVKLGDGRPFFIGLTNDYEDWNVRYVGSYFSKLNTIQQLGRNFAWFPRTNFDADPRFYNVGWYRLFPDEIGDIIYKLSTEKYADLGMLIDNDGNVHARDILVNDANGDLTKPDYTGMGRVLPSISFNHQFYAVAFAHIGMSGQFDGETDLLKSFKIAVEGGDDDFGAFDSVDPSLVAEFTHPLSGQRFRALKSGKFPISYDLIQKANLLKERYEVLNECVSDPAIATATPYCHCTENIDYRPSIGRQPDNGCNDNSDCMEDDECGHPYHDLFERECVNRDCVDPYLEAPGEAQCNDYDLRNRRDSALETMEDALDFIDDVRGWNRFQSEW